jgi:hypothetical protein
MSEPHNESPRDELNPYAAPKTDLGSVVGEWGAIEGAEQIRRAHIGHEANIKSVGSFFYFMAFLCAILTLVGVAQLAGALPAQDPEEDTVTKTISLAINGLFSSIYVFIGYGLRKLQARARWTVVVFMAIGLLCALGLAALMLVVNPVISAVILLVSGGVQGFILYFMVAPKAGVIFSPQYKRVIELTPGVKHKTSIWVFLLVILLAMGVVIAIVSMLSR